MAEVLGFCLSHINKSLQWLWFAEELRRRGVEHAFILIDPQRPLLADDLERLGSPVYHLTHRSRLSHARNLLTTIRILRSHRVTVLHTSLPFGNLIGQLAGVALGIRNRVTTAENPSWPKDQHSMKQDLIDRLTYRLARRVIVCTEMGRRYLADTYSIPDSKLAVIPHSLKVSDYESVDTGRIAAVRQALGLRPGDFVIGMVARLEAWKGHRYGIEAMKEVVRFHPEARLLIFGSKGDGYPELERCIRENGMADHVAYKGFVADNVALYRVFDIHLHVPIDDLAEAFGITVIEGMISGCAQILTRSGVSHYLARHRENAWVVDFKSSSAIAGAILALRADPGLRKRLGEEAREDALRHFDYRDKVDHHFETYGLAEAVP